MFNLESAGDGCLGGIGNFPSSMWDSGGAFQACGILISGSEVVQEESHRRVWAIDLVEFVMKGGEDWEFFKSPGSRTECA